MSDTELKTKINLVVSSIKNRITNLESNVEAASLRLKEQIKFKETNQKKYQYELEKYNYQILKNKAEINRCRLFINRCSKYLNYLDTLNQDNIITIRKSEYDIIKNIQEEAIYFYTSKLEVLDQRRVIENICDVKSDTESDKKDLIRERNKIYNTFENKEFHFDPEAVYTTDYLDFDAISVVNKLYLIDQNKKSRKAS